jgi:type III secretion system HrpE/YscL family protein
MPSRPRIIRQRGPNEPPRRRPLSASTRILRPAQLEALAEAERLLASARQEAAGILEQARAEAEMVRQQALERGQAQASAALVAAQAQARRIQVDARADLTRLAVAIAEKLLDEELALHPERVARIVERCLGQVGAARRVVLRVNPADQPTLDRELPRLRGLVEADALVLEPDPTIRAGGCLLETELGQVDGRLETQLQAILEALQAADQ